MREHLVTENELIQKIAGGDQGALETLHQRYFERLVRFLYRVTGDQDHILEIINDTFLVIWKKAGNFRGDSTVSTWILGIAYKKGLKQMSRFKPIEPLAELNASSYSIEDVTMHEQSVSHLLSQLNPQHRVVMELTYYFGYSYKEISEIVDCPENTVKTRMFHGRKHLRHLLEVHQHA